MTVKTENLAQAKTSSAQSWLLSAVYWWGLLVLTLHLAAFQLPEETAWSVWAYTLLPSWLGWTLALLAGALILSPMNHLLLAGLRRLWRAWPAKQARQRWFVLAALLAGLLFWLFRLRHLRWGDAYVLTVALAYDGPGGPLIYNWQAPLTVFIHQRLWQFVAHPLWSWPVENVYAATSILCGVVFVYVLLAFAAQVGRNTLETTAIAGLVLTTGSAQLFFGYVENYTIISVGLLLTLFLAWRALRGETQPVWPILLFSITNSLHPSTVFLWPGMWLMAWLCWRRGYVSLASAVWQTLIPPLLVGAGVLALMENGDHGLASLLGADRPGGGDGKWFVPLFETSTRWEHYTMFSLAHLLDWGNEQLLIAPFGLPLIALILIAIRRFQIQVFETPVARDYGYFLGVLAASYLLLTWLWNPDYGGRKDWDLFAPSAFIYTFLAAYLLVRVLKDRERLKEAVLFIVAVSLLHTGAWVKANTHPLPRE